MVPKKRRGLPGLVSSDDSGDDLESCRSISHDPVADRNDPPSPTPPERPQSQQTLLLCGAHARAHAALMMQAAAAAGRDVTETSSAASTLQRGSRLRASFAGGSRNFIDVEC